MRVYYRKRIFEFFFSSSFEYLKGLSIKKILNINITFVTGTRLDTSNCKFVTDPNPKTRASFTTRIETLRSLRWQRWLDVRNIMGKHLCTVSLVLVQDPISSANTDKSRTSQSWRLNGQRCAKSAGLSLPATSELAACR